MFHSLVVADRSSYWPPDHLSFSKFQQQGRCSAHNQDPIETDLEMKTQVGTKYHPASNFQTSTRPKQPTLCWMFADRIKANTLHHNFIIMARLC